MPRNSFSLTVLITGKPYRIGGLSQFAQLGNDLFFVFAHLVLRGKILLDVNADSALGKIPNVPKTGAHGEGAAEEFFNGLGLGRGFDNNEILGHEQSFTPAK